ncbi:uncharacterized protein LOC133307731 [Gastrolobium bilobum]|uniref:uncharacterized protein LOC133307731 n=1 Tax=Gastrolobium bilobum TaxID=150636 RepID=UPI002AB19141|nr:uncharacterized protein LOC133307731 [Gastrolobium bilobum]
MSRLRLAKKLQPAKKAWKSFSNRLQSKFNKLNITKSIKTTLQRLISAFHSLSNLISSKGHRSLTSKKPYATTSYHHFHHKNFAAIGIDELFSEAASVSVHATNCNKSTHATQGETSRGKEVYVNKDLVGESSGMNTIEDAWKAVVAKSPQLHVDQKAEEFISKFHEDMRLQKERSMLEFQEMLARSA